MSRDLKWSLIAQYLPTKRGRELLLRAGERSVDNHIVLMNMYVDHGRKLWGCEHKWVFARSLLSRLSGGEPVDKEKWEERVANLKAFRDRRSGDTSKPEAELVVSQFLGRKVFPSLDELNDLWIDNCRLQGQSAIPIDAQDLNTDRPVLRTNDAPTALERLCR